MERDMPVSRRRVLRLAAAAGATAAIGAVASRMVRSARSSPPIAHFQAELPIPPVLAPVRSDALRDYFEIVQREGSMMILPGLETAVWGYNGIFPGPMIRVRRGRPTVVRHVNQLKVPTVVHLHGGRTPSESDGFPTDLILPVGLPSEAVPICTNVPGRTAGARYYVYPNDQRASTLWYHDHTMDWTGRNVYMGLAGFYLIEDDEEAALPLPRGRRDIPLMICVRQFDPTGSIAYDTHGHIGSTGDVMLVNGAPWPRLEVERRKYRFRILNASNASTFDLALSSGQPLVQIATDGGLLAAPVVASSIPLAMAERVEIVIDFAEYPSGSQIVLRNLETAGPLGEIIRFDVAGPVVADESFVPDHLSTIEPLRPEAAVRMREFLLGGRPELNLPPVVWAINGRRFDPDRIDAAPRLGDVEIWRFVNRRTLFPGHVHPPHVHLVSYQVLERNGGPPQPHETGWKDTIRLAEGDDIRVIIRFDGYRGRYLLHCHNLEHEDHDMMARFDVV
jgi:FtsP/CotA-like multicopper oxidase with cupredoxin domain